MAQRSEQTKCRNCGDIFIPDYRNVGRQACCSKDECRKAGKAESQKRWLDKPENRDYFRGKANVERVRRWREKNPGYWRKKSPEPAGPLQDPLEEKPAVNQPVASTTPSPVKDALQDSLSVQCAVLTGLIILLTGCALQDDIAKVIRRLQQLGSDVLNPSCPQKGEPNDRQTPHPAGSDPTNPVTIQLGGSPAGP